MKREDIMCDSGSFISLTASCMDRTLYFLHEKFGLRFVIPPSVEYEAVTRPLYDHLTQFAFSAIRIKDAIHDGVILKVEENVRTDARHIIDLANNLFYVHGKPLKLIHLGEAEMVALAHKLDVKNLLIDERTTRMLIEAPFRLKEHLEKEFSTHIMLDKKKMREFSDITRSMNVIRSSEIVILAYENGFFNHFKDIKKEALEAALYKTKYSGCSIRFDEIKTYLKSVK